MYSYGDFAKKFESANKDHDAATAVGNTSRVAGISGTNGFQQRLVLISAACALA